MTAVGGAERVRAGVQGIAAREAFDLAIAGQISQATNRLQTAINGFGGPAGFRKPAKDSDQKRGTSAHWFGVHRRGGDTMLHHRTLKPVVIRDWSTPMEMFTGTLARTATTSTKSHRALNLTRPRTPKDYTEFAATAWFRPQPQPSTYLATAFEPVPWPERDNQQPRPTGGRPLLPSERRTRDKMPIKTNPLRPSLHPFPNDYRS